MLNIKNCTFNYKRKGVPTIDNHIKMQNRLSVYLKVVVTRL